MNVFSRLLAKFKKNDDGPKIVLFPELTKHEDNSTARHPWCFPKGYPYQVYGGPLHKNKKTQIWTNTSYLPGYTMMEDHYSDRLYLVWSGNDTPTD